MSLLYFSFVQYAVYDHVFVQLCQYHLMFRTQKPANVWVNHCLSDLCTDCRRLICYFFSSKKEIKSAGTEK